MIRFENTLFLYGLLLIPLFVVIYILYKNWQKKAFSKFADKTILCLLIPDLSKRKPFIKFLLFIIAYTSLIIGIANPQTGAKVESIERKGIDVIIALDVSKSMLAEDIKPNRIERAKMAISKMIDNFDNDRIGIIVFGGNAYTHLPITTDYSAAKLLISSVSTDIIPTQGTAIGVSINQAIEIFKNEEKYQNKEVYSKSRNKAIIIISDGENHEDDAVAEATNANNNGIKVFTVGMGSTEGCPIPISQFNGIKEFKKDKENNTVITKLNIELMKQIAQAGNGIFVHSNNTDIGLKKIIDEINNMEKIKVDTRIYTNYDSHFQYFIGLSLLIFLLELLIFNRKWEFTKNKNVFNVGINKNHIILLFIVFSSIVLKSQTENSFIRKGNKDYNSGNFKSSEIKYRKALSKNDSSFKGLFNLGDALYKQENYEQASKIFNSLTGKTENKEDLSKVYHNLGNSLLKQKKLEESIKAYKNALKLNPNDKDTKYNLAYAQALLKQQQNDKNNNNDKKQEEKKQEEKKENNQQDKQEKQQIEQMLNALDKNEQKLQENMKKEKQKAVRVYIEKDW